MAIFDTLYEQSGAIVTGVIILYLLRKVAIYTKLRQFGGPIGTGISDWPHSKALLSPNCHEWYESISKQYGGCTILAVSRTRG